MNIDDKRKEFMAWPEYKEYPELFSDRVLAKASIKKIKAMIHS